MRHLLVFARTPRPGAVKTRLAPVLGPEGAAALYRAFLADLARQLRELRATTVEWLVDGDTADLTPVIGDGWTLSPQAVGNLGVRLAAGFRSAFDRGAGPVAAVGPDCPLLTAGDLEALFDCVEATTDAALVPAVDGGYVALALGARCDAAFEGIPWSTPGALAATREALAGAGRRVRLLPTRRDVDTAEDLAHLAQELEASPSRAPATGQLLAALDWPGRALRDALGREVPLVPEPRRIVSLVPSVTECLFDVGAGHRVVGRTDFCISPAAARALPGIGGPKTVDRDAVLALHPDLVLANAEENDRSQVEALAAAGLRIHVAFPRTLAQAAAFLRDLGRLLRCPESTGPLVSALEALEAPPGPPVPCACLIWRAPYMTASEDTLTSALLAAAGAANVFASRPARYPEVTEAELAASGARVVLLPSEPYEFTADDARDVEQLVPGAAALRIPGEWVTWYGSRMVQAIEGLRRTLEPFRRRTLDAGRLMPDA